MTLIPYTHNFFIERRTGEDSGLVVPNANGNRDYKTGALTIDTAPFHTDLKAWLAENAPCAMIWCWYARGGFTIALPDEQALPMRLRWCPPLDWCAHTHKQVRWDTERGETHRVY